MHARVVIFIAIALLLLLLLPSSLLMAEKIEKREIDRIPILPLPGFSEINRRNAEAAAAQDSTPSPTSYNENEAQTASNTDDADNIGSTQQSVTPAVPQPEDLEQPATETVEWYEIGNASWYGGRFQGRKTANGEVFDTNLLTAAHKTLPFNTIIRVYNPKNDESVLVRINDRGPFVDNRIIDLSRAAAVQIDTAAAGISEVRLEIIRLGEEPKVVKIQMGAFAEYENATDLVTNLKRDGFNPQIEAVNDEIFRVVLIDIAREQADFMLQKLDSKGYSKVFVRTER